MKRCLVAGLFALLGSALPSVAAGTWVPLANSPPGAAGHFLLLSDGTVIAENLTTNYGPGWFRLTPDIHGSYVKGTWSTIASMHDTRLDFASDVLIDGRVFVAGGEYGSGFATSEVYDPVSNIWTVVPVPTGLLDPTKSSQQFNELQGFNDCSSVVILTGQVLIAPTEASMLGQTMLFNPDSNSWTAGPATVYQQLGYQAEASWVALADGSILTVDGYATSSERYIPDSNAWVADATVPVALYDSSGEEEGPALLLPNGKAIFFGGTGHTAIYTPSGGISPGSWVAGPDFPNSQGMPDAPAAMMVNGKILCAVSQAPFGTNIYNSPTSFYEYDYLSNSFTPVNAPGGGSTFPGPSWPTLMLDLPDGSVLFTHRSTDLYVYQPDGVPLAAGKPAIASITTNNDGSLHLTGTLFNGISHGAAYGDDEQMDSNYPLVRFIDASGNVRYGRTYNWSSTGVMTGNTVVSTDCTVPAGASRQDAIQVVVNGIASVTGLVNPKLIALGGSLSFGVVPIGSFAQGSIIISNLGHTTLTVSNISYPSVAFSGAWSGTIPAQGSQIVPVTFSPASPTNYSGTVMITSSTTNGDTSLPVTAFGVNTNLVLTVITSGDGIVTGAPKPATRVLAPNMKVTLKAVPGKDSVFFNWAGSYNTSRNPLTFSMTTNTIVEANFISNPFAPFIGTYNGLFWAGDGVTGASAGMLRGLSVTSKGTYSGALLINGGSHAFTGRFNLEGRATNTIAHTAEGPVEVVMTLTSNAPAPQIIGTVSGAGFVANNLMAGQAADATASAQYTLLIQPDANVTSVIGNGYALITNHSGTPGGQASSPVKITGALADGTAFSQSVSVSRDGWVPIYASLYNGKGLLLGWINLEPTNASGPLAWVHQGAHSGLFTTSFTSTNPIMLSPWTNPPAGSALPTNLAVVETTGITPSGTSDYTIMIPNGTLNFGKLTGPAALSRTIAPKTGLIKVTVGSGPARKTGCGVVLLNGADGGGYYVTRTNAGSFLLSP